MEQTAIALIDYIEQQQSNVIVNGVPQGGKLVRVYYLKCSHCQRVLGQFNAGESYRNVAAYSKNEFSKNFVYCPSCGCRLDYTCDVIDVHAA